MAAQPESASQTRTSIAWLLVWGSGGLVNYLILAYLAPRFIFGYGHTERPIVQVVAVLTAAWVAWLGGCYIVLRHRLQQTLSKSELSQNAKPLAVILLFALVYRLILIPTRPIQEADLYRYLWDGLLAVNGINPYAHTPAELADRLTWAYHEHLRGRPIPDDELVQRLSRMLSEHQVHNRRLMQLALAHHGQMPTTYPPGAQAVFALVAAMCSDSWQIEERVILLKTVLGAFDLATLLVLVLVLREVGWPLTWCLVYAWCPLVLKEIANSGHVESVAIFWCTLAWWQLLRQRWAWAGLWWALAVLTKVYPLALVPLLLGWLGQRGGRAALIRFFAPALATFVVLVWLAEPTTARRSAGTGLVIFLREWETNDFLFQHTKNLLDVCLPNAWQDYVASWPAWPRRLATGDPEQQASALALWSALVGSTAAAEIQRVGLIPISLPFVLAYALHVLVYLALAVSLTWRASREKVSGNGQTDSRCVGCLADSSREHRDSPWLRATFLALAWLFLLVPTGNPWYFLWCLPWLICAQQRAWYLLPGLLAQYYLYFWFVYHYPSNEPGVWHTGMPGYRFFHQVWLWLEYAPFFLVLVFEYLIHKKRPNPR